MIATFKYRRSLGLFGVLTTVSLLCYYLVSYSIHDTDKRQFSRICESSTLHIAFVKTHKTASSTVTNIIQRFGESHRLTFVLPKPPDNYLWFERNAFSNRLMGHPKGGNRKFDLLCNHGIYNRAAMSKLLPKDTVYITILRHPVNQFLSAFFYYRTVYKVPYLVRIPDSDPVLKYLQSPKRYEPATEYMSYTNNRMSVDLGIPQSVFNRTNLLASFINRLDHEFELVMIMEYFDESLVLLRRLLCWKLEDIVYVRLNVRQTNSYNVTLTSETFTAIKEWARADIQLYEHFYKKFWRKINQMGQEFWTEVETYKQIQVKVNRFCMGMNSSRLSSLNNEYLLIDKSEWNEKFLIDQTKCKLLRMNEVKFTNYLSRLQQ